MKLTRRTMLIGGGAAVIVVAGGGAAALRFWSGSHTPEAEAATYAKLLADVHDDYVNGRVVEYQGWVLSQHEFDTIDARRNEAPAKPADGIS